MGRTYPDRPIVGVGVAIKRGSRVLLIKRGVEPGLGLWSIPGGVVKLGEQVEEAGKREVREETGLEIEIDGLLDVLDNVIYDERGKIRYHYVLVDFLAHPTGGRLKVASDAQDAQWIDIDKVDQYPLTKTFRRLLQKLRRFYSAENE
ncbi:MAG: NUDIX hydrolase [Candidatus Bathyarchaeia archaeon]